MKRVRFGSPGQERPGIVDSSGTLRDLAGVTGDLTPDAISDDALAGLRALDLARLPAVGGTVRLGCPLAAIGKFIAIGLNSSDHAARWYDGSSDASANDDIEWAAACRLMDRLQPGYRS